MGPADVTDSHFIRFKERRNTIEARENLADVYYAKERLLFNEM